jgi:hypothetical protein
MQAAGAEIGSIIHWLSCELELCVLGGMGEGGRLLVCAAGAEDEREGFGGGKGVLALGQYPAAFELLNLCTLIQLASPWRELGRIIREH